MVIWGNVLIDYSGVALIHPNLYSMNCVTTDPGIRNFNLRRPFAATSSTLKHVESTYAFHSWLVLHV